MKSQFKQVHSRISLDVATFTFGILNNEKESFTYKLFCAGSESHYVDKLAPLNEEMLFSLIHSLQSLSPSNPKLKTKIRINSFSNVKLRFSGFEQSKGYKVKASLGGFLFYSSSGFFSSYCTENNLQNLINNLKRCTGQGNGT